MTTYVDKYVGRGTHLFTANRVQTNIMQISVQFPQNAKKNPSITKFSYTTFGYIPKGVNTFLWRYLFIHVYCCSL